MSTGRFSAREALRFMRILQVIHSFPPYNTSGTEVYSYTLAKELSANNVDEQYFS